MSTSVFIAVPTYTGQIDVCAVSALVKNMTHLLTQQVPCQVYFEIGCCYISQARNRIVGEFLDSNFENLIMLDSDTYCQDDTFYRLCDNTHHVVVAAYPYRHGTDGWPIRVYTNPDMTPSVTSDKFIRCEVAPTGIIRISRAVLERIIVEHPEWRTQNVTKKGNPIYDIFKTGLTRGDGHWYGEDYNFSLICNDMGVPVLCMPDVDVEHAGGRNNRIGNYHQYLLGLPKPGDDDGKDDDAGLQKLGAECVPQMVSDVGS